MNDWPIPLYVLAGGMATRLGALSQKTPKYLMPVDKKNCFADVHLQWVAEQGFKEVVLCVGHLAQQIEFYCGDGSRWGLKIRYSEDGPKLLGTGGALAKAYRESSERPSAIAITYGDTLLSINCKDAYTEFSKTNFEGLMSVYQNEVPGHNCNALVGHKRFEYDKVKPPAGARHIDYGFLILNSKVLGQIPAGEVVDLANPLSKLSKESKLMPFIAKIRFWEIGSPQSLEEFRKKSPYARKV